MGFNDSSNVGQLVPPTPDQDDSPLSIRRIRQVMEQVCTQVNQDAPAEDWIFSVANQEDLDKDDGDGLLFGLVATKQKQKPSNSEEGLEQKQQQRQLATFFIAYSTWEGRVLFRDYTSSSNNKDIDFSQQQALNALWYWILARIATALHCSRLVWVHLDDQDDGFPTIIKKETKEELKPQRFPGWLTLKWKASGIQDFLEAKKEKHDNITKDTPSKTSSPSSLPCTPRHGFKAAFSSALNDFQEQPHNQNEDFRLRLASSAKDAHEIVRLVHALAVYENEQDNVHLGLQHFLMDGGLQQQQRKSDGDHLASEPSSETLPTETGKEGDDQNLPLFYCVLIDTTTNDHEPTQPCGIAFCYVGYNLTNNTSDNDDSSTRASGRFLYLEDLFIEERYRGKGVGSWIMGALGHVSQAAFQCTAGMKWQSLEWDTKAQQFYRKRIGAVDSGLNTSRIGGQVLKDFAQLDRDSVIP